MASPSRPKETTRATMPVAPGARVNVAPGKEKKFPVKLALQVLLIVAAGLWLYAPALYGQQLWDDGWYSASPLLRGISGLWKIWFEPGQWVEYYPIEETVQWIQVHLWDTNVLYYHLTNVLLHIVSGLLVWRLLTKFGLHFAWLGGLLFVVHPVQVESVAWMVELKNTLSLPPFLLAMIAWIDFEEHRRPRDYWLALGLFLVAMLCKVSMLLFPVVILLYAWWKRGRVGWVDVRMSVPFLIISVVLAAMTIHAGNVYREQLQQADDVVHLGGLGSRVALAGLIVSFYFSQCVWPLELLPIYPLWKVDPPSPVQFLPWAVWAGLAWWLWQNRAGRGRHVALGLGFFLINLAPLTGLTPVSYMKFSWVMDHFLYLPIIGLIGLAMAGLESVETRLPVPARAWGLGALALLLGAMAWRSHVYAGKFVDQETLWSYTIDYNPDAWIARNNLGNILAQHGHIPEARQQYEAALQSNSDYAEAHCNLGVMLEMTGHSNEAVEQYDAALRINPHYTEAHDNLGQTLLHLGRIPEAMDHFQAAVQIAPDNAQAHYWLGIGFRAMGQPAPAAKQFEQVLTIDPTDPVTHNILGSILLQTGQVSDAITQFEQALQLKPDFVEAHFNLGKALLQSNRFIDAVDQFTQAVRLNPNLAVAQLSLGDALLRSGHATEALDHYMEAVQLQPGNPEAHNNLGVALIQLGRRDDAAKQFQAALQLQPKYPEAQKNLTALQKLPKAAPVTKTPVLKKPATAQP